MQKYLKFMTDEDILHVYFFQAAKNTCKNIQIFNKLKYVYMYFLAKMQNLYVKAFKIYDK